MNHMIQNLDEMKEILQTVLEIREVLELPPGTQLLDGVKEYASHRKFLEVMVAQVANAVGVGTPVLPEIQRLQEVEQKLKAAQARNKKLAADLDYMVKAEETLSASYLRIRNLLKGWSALDTSHGPTEEEVYRVTEDALQNLIDSHARWKAGAQQYGEALTRIKGIVRDH